jgi:hypothetical protein
MLSETQSIAVSPIIVRRARENAERGLAYLDANHPDWTSRVPRDVDIKRGDHCVVHFLTDEIYHVGVNMLNIKDPVSLGFFVPGDIGSSSTIEEYARLTLHLRAGRASRLKARSAAINTGPGATPVQQHEAPVAQYEEEGELVGV